MSWFGNLLVGQRKTCYILLVFLSNNFGSTLLLLCQSTPCHTDLTLWLPMAIVSCISEGGTPDNQKHCLVHIQNGQGPGNTFHCLVNSPDPLANDQLVLGYHSQVTFLESDWLKNIISIPTSVYPAQLPTLPY